MVFELLLASSLAAAPGIEADPIERTPTPEDDIVVTGERTPRPVRDTPSSVVVLTRSAIEATGADRLDQLLELVPNVQVGSGEEGPAIRGQDSTGPCAICSLSSAVGTPSTASGEKSTAVGEQSQATGARSSAIGSEATATATGANAFGWQARATSNFTLAAGHQALASGLNATAVGPFTQATGMGASAFGNGAMATQAGTVSLGVLSRATAANGTAVGALANASGVGSTAIGRGSAASFDGSTAVNQVALGGAGTSVRIGDIASSTAAQVGPIGIATVDANGTIGRDMTLIPALSTLQTLASGQASQISTLQAADRALSDGLTTCSTCAAWIVATRRKGSPRLWRWATRRCRRHRARPPTCSTLPTFAASKR